MVDIINTEFEGERPLYRRNNLRLKQVTIHEGESAIKECVNIEAENCRFEGKYVFWEDSEVQCRNCYFSPTARASVWYSKSIKIIDSLIDAQKTFRRAENILLENVKIPHAAETFWDCKNVELNNCEIKEADYVFMHSQGIRINNYHQDGNYSFQYAQDVVVTNAVINTKDAFWESEKCTLIDCEINGEYLGWYSRDLHLIRCHITGTQPLCYCTNLVLEDCTFGDNADLAFEYSGVKATIKGSIHSIKNPTTGSITADSIGEIIIDKNQKSPADCQIICNNVNN